MNATQTPRIYGFLSLVNGLGTGIHTFKKEDGGDLVVPAGYEATNISFCNEGKNITTGVGSNMGTVELLIAGRGASSQPASNLTGVADGDGNGSVVNANLIGDSFAAPRNNDSPVEMMVDTEAIDAQAVSESNPAPYLHVFMDLRRTPRKFIKPAEDNA